MLEGLAAWVLNTYIGEYLENLNTDQLSIGLLQGEVELENLPLKKDALKYLGLPIQVKAGFVGKIRLQIPLYRLRSEPWVISIEKLYVVLGPLCYDQYDEEKAEQAVQDYKLSQLDHIEGKWKVENEAKKDASYYAYSYSSWMSYGSSVVSHIVQNIQLKVKDVHIRYEDNTTIPSNSFAFGVLVRNLSAQSADESWEEKYLLKDSSEIMRKLLELDHLAVYWDSNATMLGHLDAQELTRGMQRHMESCVSSQGWVTPHDYLLYPVSAKARVQKNCSAQPLRSKSTPRIICDLELERISLALTETQYKQLVDWLQKIDTVSIIDPKKRKPTETAIEKPKDWWKYAIQCHLSEIQQRNSQRNWNFAHQRAKDVLDYVELYHTHLTKPEGLNPTMKARQDAIEHDLTFRELCDLRGLVTEQLETDNKVAQQKESPTGVKGRSLLMSWFPGWSGWYSSQNNSVDSPTQDEVDDPGGCQLQNKIEDEILDVLDSVENDTVLRRDIVFARLNFSLQQGSISLLSQRSNSFQGSPVSPVSPIGSAPSESGTTSERVTKGMQPFLELEFSDVKTSMETRPRNGSYLFEIKLGALYLHDKLTSKPIFHDIVFPQNKEISVSHSKSASRSSLYRNHPSGLAYSSFLQSNMMSSPTTSNDPIFELCYEHKPFNSRAMHRLMASTRPLEIIYNIAALEALSDFFSLNKCLGEKRQFTSAARSRYENIKQQTKTELMQRLDQIFETDERIPEAVHWEISLDISAPQIIVPDNLQDKNSIVVVFDLGRLRFSNFSASNKSVDKQSNDELDSDDEEFKTPCSTPVEDDEVSQTTWFTEETTSEYRSSYNEGSVDTSIRDRLYEKYTLELCDTQVLVARAKDNWKFAQIRGTSTMHILDRFSISILLERRLILSTDPSWPAVTLSGNLPKMVLHINEQKIQALNACADLLGLARKRPPSRRTSQWTSVSLEGLYHPKDTGEAPVPEENLVMKQEKRSSSPSSVLLLMQFCVEQLSLEVQSRGRSIAELQVTGVQSTFTKRPWDLSISLCVHSLLLVDAVQTYGPDFELLIASHKKVCIDSMSGSLKDSEPNSPTCPASPDLCSSPPVHPHYLTPPPPCSTAIKMALSSLQDTESKGSAGKRNSLDPNDTDALITVEFTLVNSPDGNDDDSIRLISVQFNNLDVIANQETVVELVSFVQRVTSHSGNVKPSFAASSQNSVDLTFSEGSDLETLHSNESDTSRTEVTFDFHRLNVLLLQAVTRKRSSVAQKIATATLSGAKIQASFGKCLEVTGALGGLQVLDLITEGTNHQRILSVGHDPLAEKPVDLLKRLEHEVYKPRSRALSTDEQTDKALTFVVKQSPAEETDKGSAETYYVNIRMASVCYTHAPQPLRELASCATELREYISSLARSIKSAATEVAKGFVSRWPDVSTFVFENMEEDEFISALNINDTQTTFKPISDKIDVRLDILLQTPIIVLPFNPSSFEVLVAHLGRITIQNVNSAALQSPEFLLYSCDPYRSETVFVEVKDMNLYSLNVEDNIEKFCVDEVAIVPSMIPAQDLYSCTCTGHPILHDTLIECSVDKLATDRDGCETVFDGSDMDAVGRKDDQCLLQVQAKVVTPLKVVLSKKQYEQVLNTLSRLMNEGSTDRKEEPSSEMAATPQDELLLGDPMLRIPSSHFLGGNEPLGGKNNAENSPLLMRATFSVPEFSVQLVTEERKQGLVKLSFQEFKLEFEKIQEASTLLQITLHGLIMEDLMEPLSSKHRLLMASVCRSSTSSRVKGGRIQVQDTLFRPSFLSTSCPDNISQYTPYLVEHYSLPDHLDTQNLFQLQQSRRMKAHGWGDGCSLGTTKKGGRETGSYPSTPPPSPNTGQKRRQSRKSSSPANALVNINVRLVDPNSWQFVQQYKKVHKHVDIDFNCLETILNLQTWVMLLDFFGIGSESETPSGQRSPTPSEINMGMHSNREGFYEEQQHQQYQTLRKTLNSDYNITVSSLTLVLNKQEYELARANVSSFSAQLKFQEGNLSIQGALGSMSLLDLTHPHGLYKERFITTGKEALHFEIFKYGRPDPDLNRTYDVSVKCQMSSVRYVHTRRFLAETLAFFQYFNQLHDFMVKINLRGTTGEAMLMANRGSRILLDVSAGSPIIIIPQHHSSSDVLVADLGKLYVHNTFQLAGSSNTFSKVTRIISPDCSMSEFDFETNTMASDVMTQSIFGSLDGDARSLEMERSDSHFMIEKYFEKRDALSASNHVCLLDVMNVELADMDLYSACYVVKSQPLDKETASVDPKQYEIEFPSFYLQRKGGQLLKEKFMLQVQVERNLDSEISHSVPDMTMHGMMSSVHFVIDQSQLKLVLGLLNYNLGESSDQFTASTGRLEEPVAYPMSVGGQPWTLLAINMDLVNVTLELVHSHPRLDCANSGQPLAKLDFIKSRLCYESFSDSSKDVDLVSHQIRISDTRYQNDPVNTRPNVFTNILQPTHYDQGASLLQAEIHYRNTKEMTRLTVLLNNMRIMGIFDWIKLMRDFIGVSPDVPIGYEEANSLKTVSSVQFENLKTQSVFELKLNVTDTELVIIENTAHWDSNAIILKATAVLAYRSGSSGKPLSCSLQSLEVFSAVLGIEDETALSIIDPVTVNIDVTGKSSSLQNSILTSENTVHTLEVLILNLNFRLSYHDITLFLQIMDSFKKQMGNETNRLNNESPTLTRELYSDTSVQRLKALGFKTEDCLHALDSCDGKLDAAAIWLTDNIVGNPTIIAPFATSTLMGKQHSSKEKGERRSLNLMALEFRVEAGCVCIIDDCDADVPLLEITVADLFVQHKLGETEEGSASFILSSGYFNRSLSGWEPFLEPWKCSLKWKRFSPNLESFTLKVEGDDILNLNITTTLLDLYSTVKKNWTEDYYKMGMKDSEDLTNVSNGYRNRQPFVPFALKNDTGVKLSFALLTSTDSSYKSPQRFSSVADYGPLTWTEVLPNQITPFSFEERDKIRHSHSHELKIHQLVVRVSGWHQVAPVSLDRVGVYFRQAELQIRRSASVYVKEPAARVVFDVTLEGSAKKLVTVRSALLLRNRLRDTLELQLRHGNIHLGTTMQTLFLVPDSITPVPLNFVNAQIFAKPSEKAVTFCNNNIEWQHIQKTNETVGTFMLCSPLPNGSDFYSYNVLVKRENYSGEPSPSQVFSQPGHCISFLPPLEVINLLPYELHFTVSQPYIKSYVKPGRSVSIHNVNINSQLVFRFMLENFGKSNDLVVNRTNHDFVARLELYDNEDRLLLLSAKISVLPGGSLKVSLVAPYWLVNRTGLPLVFRQDGTQGEAAGQFLEHETARSVSPLLFSLADEEASVMCSVRVGKRLHSNASAQWCSRFHLEKGISVRRLRVTPNDSRPDWVYMIGIEVQMGKGRFQDTYIVTLSPRFQLENKSGRKLEFAQRFATKRNDSSPGSYHGYSILSAMPKSSLPFHWPRVDLDNLLCVRIVDEPNCHWSGGFIIERISSFHVNMRDSGGKSFFLRVEVILQGAKFIIILREAEGMPPPFRIDNNSDVSIVYFQTNVREERLESIIKPHSSVPYAFDEPSLQSLITCCAPGGSSDTYNMDVFGEGKRLYYENFIYIAFTGTFQRSWSTSLGGEDNILGEELVLDVPQGTRVILTKKEAGKRSQLWRMTSKGMLQHEGSSPPRDHRRPFTPLDMGRCLFLDIAGLGPHPGQQVPLMLRKGDERRNLTQTWRFTEDGRLCCGHPNMFVQALDGFYGMKPGRDAVLGPNLPVQYKLLEGGVPFEQALSTQKLRKGSGMLCVKVVPDGPTRVLQISDFMQKQILTRANQNSDWVVVEERNMETTDPPSPSSDNASTPSKEEYIKMKLVVTVHLSGGLGLSISNHLGEELIYSLLQNIMVEYCRSPTGDTLDGSIQNIQVDNQLRDAERSSVLFLYLANKNDQQRHMPAIHVTAYRTSMPHINAEIFKHLMVTVRSITLQLEEKLLLKMVQFLGAHKVINEVEQLDELDTQIPRNICASEQPRLYYFGVLKLSLPHVRLSVVTSSTMPPELQRIKRRMGWTLIRFEDAMVELNPFLSVHPFETMKFLKDSVLDHYEAELRSQAAKILGAVNFLGNPLGLVNDVSDGLVGLIYEGNVGGLVKNVAHGLSNSAAKMTGTLSDSLGMVSMDAKHQSIRKRIRQDTASESSTGADQFVAGLKGLGFGLFGGVTSIFTQTYEGAVNEGVPGFFSGLGKGLVGTVTKPTVGILDFASGAASAVRDTSKRSVHTPPGRVRPPRLCAGPGGLLTRYSLSQSLGQELLYSLNNRNYHELVVAYEQIRSNGEDLRVLITSQQVFVLSRSPPSVNVVMAAPFKEIFFCEHVASQAGVLGSNQTRHYIQFNMTTSDLTAKRPMVRCDSEDIAKKISQLVNYAKSLYEEKVYTVIIDISNEKED